MKVFNDLCIYIDDARSGFDTLAGVDKYLMLNDSLSKINGCIEYIKYNEDFIRHTVFIETFKSLLTV